MTDRQAPSQLVVPEPTARAMDRTLTRGGWPWLFAAALALLGLMPVLARLLAGLAGAEAATAPTGVGVAASAALLVHATSGTLFSALGAIQFPTALWRHKRGFNWHPWVGRLLVPLGLIAAISALWLTLFYTHTGVLLYVFRLAFGLGMVACLITGYVAIRRRAVLRHRAWMMRAYAIGLGAGTQIFTLAFGGPLLGTGEVSTALLTVAGWMINLAVAEWLIHRRPRPGGPGFRSGSASTGSGTTSRPC